MGSRPSSSRSSSGSRCRSPRTRCRARPSSGWHRRSWLAGWRACSTGSRPPCSRSRWPRGRSSRICGGRCRQDMVPGQMVPGQMPGAGGGDDSPQRGSGPSLNVRRVAQGRPPDGQRASHVDELACPVHLGPPVPAGRAVRERDLDLSDPHALAEQIDREPGLHAESRRERACRLERGAGQAALPIQRLSWTPSGCAHDAGTGQAYDEAVTALLRPGTEHRDRHVRPGLLAPARPAGPPRQRSRPGLRPGTAGDAGGRGARCLEQADGLGSGLHRGGLAPVTGVPSPTRRRPGLPQRCRRLSRRPPRSRCRHRAGRPLPARSRRCDRTRSWPG